MTDPAAPEPLSFRWPAEWEPLEAVWVVPPHNEETWPGCLDEARAEHAAWCDAMAEVVPVRTPDELGIATNDSWIRDFGPLFVFDAEGKLAIQDFRFNGWGDKYELRDRDDTVSQKLAEALGLPIIRHDTVLEGGALETDGRGTLLTTPECVLHPNRNDHANRDEFELRFSKTLGITKTFWLPLPDGGLPGDDTDGHIDNAARFLPPADGGRADTVAVHPALDATPLREAGYQIVTLPAVEPIIHDYPADRFGPAKQLQLPCSYANFLIANGSVFVPTFGQASDDVALRMLDDAMPHHRPVPIRSNHLIVGLGAMHCLSMQQPAAPQT
ncbi:MAG: agmatine deiminase family protein [Planctomycetota bacterium]